MLIFSIVLLSRSREGNASWFAWRSPCGQRMSADCRSGGGVMSDTHWLSNTTISHAAKLRFRTPKSSKESDNSACLICVLPTPGRAENSKNIVAVILIRTHKNFLAKFNILAEAGYIHKKSESRRQQVAEQWGLLILTFWWKSSYS